MSAHHAESHCDNVVGWMSSGRKSSFTCKRFVHRSQVSVSEHNVISLHWLEPNVWHFCEKHFWMWFVQHMLFSVPSASLKVKSPDVCTIWSLLVHVILGSVINNFKVEFDDIYSDDVLPCIILLQASQEGLSKVESWNPHLSWSSLVNPILDEL